MTFVFKSETINDIVIEISQDKFEECYKVSAYRLNKSGIAYAINERTYYTIKQAQVRFTYLKSKAKKEEI